MRFYSRLFDNYLNKYRSREYNYDLAISKRKVFKNLEKSDYSTTILRAPFTLQYYNKFYNVTCII